jgi:hypothetical protein
MRIGSHSTSTPNAWRTRREFLAAMDRYLPRRARRRNRVAGPLPDFGHLSDRATLCGITLWLQAKHPKRRNKEVQGAFPHKHFKYFRPPAAQDYPGRGAWLASGAHRLERSEIAQVIELDVSRSTLAAPVSVATPLTLNRRASQDSCKLCLERHFPPIQAKSSSGWSMPLS